MPLPPARAASIATRAAVSRRRYTQIANEDTAVDVTFTRSLNAGHGYEDPASSPNDWNDATSALIGDLGAGIYTGACTLPDFNVPAAATINTATLTFEQNFIAAIGGGLGTINVQAEESVSSAAPSASNLPSSWSLTTETATFTARATTGSNDETLDVSDIIQAIVDQGSWPGAARINFRIAADAPSPVKGISVTAPTSRNVVLAINYTPA